MIFRIKRGAFLIVVLFTLTSCHPLFCVWNMGYDRVTHFNRASLVGKYVLSKYSKKMMEYEGGYKKIPNSIIDLKANGSYTIINAPDWLSNNFNVSQQTYFNKDGKWGIICNENGCVLELDGVQIEEMVYEKADKKAILLTVGDPDSCQGMVYEKQ